MVDFPGKIGPRVRNRRSQYVLNANAIFSAVCDIANTRDNRTMTKIMLLCEAAGAPPPKMDLDSKC